MFSGVYYLFNLLVLIVAILVSVFVVYVRRRHETGKPPPLWLQKVTLNSLCHTGDFPVQDCLECKLTLIIAKVTKSWQVEIIRPEFGIDACENKWMHI